MENILFFYLAFFLSVIFYVVIAICNDKYPATKKGKLKRDRNREILKEEKKKTDKKNKIEKVRKRKKEP